MEVILTEVPLEQIATDGTEWKPKARLIESMQQFGLLRPLLLRDRPDGRYELAGSGEPLAAARRLGWDRIPALLRAREAPAPGADHETLIVYAQRVSLETLHVARLASRLIQQRKCTQAELGEQLGLKQSTLSRMIRVARCPELEAAVMDGLAFGAARELVSLPETERQTLLTELRETAAREGQFPSVRQVAERVRRPRAEASGAAISAEELATLAAQLQARALPVAIHAAADGAGHVRISLRVEAAELAGCRAAALAAAAAAAAPAKPVEPRGGAAAGRPADSPAASGPECAGAYRAAPRMLRRIVRRAADPRGGGGARTNAARREPSGAALR